MSTDKNILAVPIGNCTARAEITSYSQFHLTLQSTSGVDDGAFYPAQDVQVYGDAAIEQLKDFCILILEKRNSLKDAVKSGS